MADNLGAHSVAGFVESFSGSHVCQFCLGEWSEFQSKVVRSGGFQQRTKAVCAACSDSFVYSESDSLLWWWGTVCTIWKTWSFPCNIWVILQMFYMTFQWNWQCHLMSWSRRNLSLALGTEWLHFISDKSPSFCLQQLCHTKISGKQCTWELVFTASAASDNRFKSTWTQASVEDAEDLRGKKRFHGPCNVPRPYRGKHVLSWQFDFWASMEIPWSFSTKTHS